MEINPPYRILYFNPWMCLHEMHAVRSFPWPRYPGTSLGPSSNYFIASFPSLFAVPRRTSLIEEPGHKLHPSLPPPYNALHCSLDSSHANEARPCFFLPKLGTVFFGCKLPVLCGNVNLRYY